ncbi:hypothetical protein [Immundisolibacter sp.]|uniref:hypothetical protein n=1 Tax=Immundisolibacter sp. TaxID=1934948 RepID=UPI00356409AA
MTKAPAAGDRLATLAAWLVGGGWPVAAALALLGVLPLLAALLPGAILLLPLLLVGNGAVVSLLALESEGGRGVRWLLWAVLLLAVPAVALGPALLVPVVFAWTPALIAGYILRSTRSLPLALLLLTLLAVVVVLLAETVGLPGGDAQSRASVTQMLRGLDPQIAGEVLDVVWALASGLLALALLSTWMGGLLAGRSLQARLRRPGALAAEFRGLRCGRAYGLVAVVAVAVALGVGLGAGGLAVELAMVSVVPLLLQGLAVMHRLALRGGGWRRAPWVVYPLLVLATPQVAPPLALVGLMDNWLDFGNGSPPVGADPR